MNARHTMYRSIPAGAPILIALDLTSCDVDKTVLSQALEGFVDYLDTPVSIGSRELKIRRRCEREGIGIYPVLPYYQDPPSAQAGFVLGFSALREDDIREGIRRLAGVVF